VTERIDPIKGEREGEHHFTRAEWFIAVQSMAAAVRYCDCCPKEHTPTDPHWSAVPFRISRDGDNLLCWYWCPVHECIWSCNYLADVTFMVTD
jgi:hypothetical protein